MKKIQYKTNRISNQVKPVKQAYKQVNQALRQIQQARDPNISSTLQRLRKDYGRIYSYGALLQANFAVYITDPLGNLERAGATWHKDIFPLSLLAADVDLSLGSLNSEDFQVGAIPYSYMTEASGGTIDVTFIETKYGDIAKSYEAARNLIINKDGSVNEVNKYIFQLHISVYNEEMAKRHVRSLPIYKTYTVSVKEGHTSLSSSGRSEIIKHQITFQKIRPYMTIPAH